MLSADALTYRTQTVVMPLVVGDGETDSRVAMFANPGMERVIIRHDGSSWFVSLDAWSDVGFKPRGQDFDLDQPLPGIVARIVGNQVVIEVAAEVTPYEFTGGIPHPIGALIREKSGLILGISHAIDPASINSIVDLRPALVGNNMVMAWVGLAS